MSSTMDVDSADSISAITCMVNCLNRKERKEVKITIATTDADVAEIRQQLALMLNLQPSESLNLMAFGQKMEDNKRLNSFGLRKTSRLQAVIFKPPETTSTHGTKPSSESIVKAKNVLVKLRRQKGKVFEMMKKPETLTSLVSNSEALRRDYMAQVILKDPSTLMTMLKQTNHEKIVDELFVRHPALVDAVIDLHAKLPIRGATADSTSTLSSRNNFFLDRADDDDYDEEVGAAEPSQRSQSGPQQQQQTTVTSTQLQSALQSALSNTLGGNSGTQNQAPVPAARNRPAPDVQPAATQPAVTQPSAPQRLQPNPESAMDNLARQYHTQLQQIQNLGITDRALALQALYASNGDLQLALDIIYSSM